ncbi:unnamed protein product, partial [Didymodactylos carnosus]
MVRNDIQWISYYVNMENMLYVGLKQLRRIDNDKFMSNQRYRSLFKRPKQHICFMNNNSYTTISRMDEDQDETTNSTKTWSNITILDKDNIDDEFTIKDNNFNNNNNYSTEKLNQKLKTIINEFPIE